MSACNTLTIMFWLESLSECNVECVVLLVLVSWCKRWSLHTCPPFFAGKLKTMRSEGFARFLRITDEQHELLGSRRDEHFILHVESCYCMKYNSHVWTVNLSSSSLFAGPWLLPQIPALGHNSYGTPSLISDVLCTRLQLFLLHGLKQTAGALPFAVHVSELTLHMTLVGDKFLELDGSRVHVINTVDDIACSFCVIQTRSNPE